MLMSANANVPAHAPKKNIPTAHQIDTIISKLFAVPCCTNHGRLYFFRPYAVCAVPHKRHPFLQQLGTMPSAGSKNPGSYSRTRKRGLADAGAIRATTRGKRMAAHEGPRTEDHRGLCKILLSGERT